MNKILTIIIPTYNMEKYLHKCLDSLFVSDENMQQLEVLVVNDGSKDSSSSIGHDYEAKYPQTFRVIDKENGNYGSCINRGLKEATGKYVKVLDADDYSIPQNLNGYLSFLLNVDTDVIITDFDIVDINGAVTDKREFHLLFGQGESIIPFSQLLKEKRNVAFQMHALTYKLRILREMNYKQTEGISYTDAEWATIPMTRVKTICYYPHSIYNYLIGREGQTMANYLEVANHKQLFQVVEKLSKFYMSQSYEVVYNQYVENKLKKALAGIYESGLKFCSLSIEELKYYDEQLKCYPQVYELANSLKLLRDHIEYVRHWRSGNPIRVLLFIKMPLVIKNIKKWIISLH